MICPKCKSDNVANLRVDSSIEINNTSNYRYYICKDCGHEFKKMSGYSNYVDELFDKKRRKYGSR